MTKKLFSFSSVPKTVPELLSDVEELYINLDNKYSKLSEEYQTLLDLHEAEWRDETIKELEKEKKLLQEQINSNRGFDISKEEWNRINEWKDNHYNEAHNAKTTDSRLRMNGAIGGNFLFEFCLTSIGTFGTCICDSCRRKAMKEANGDFKKLRQLKEKYDFEFVFQEL